MMLMIVNGPSRSKPVRARSSGFVLDASGGAVHSKPAGPLSIVWFRRGPHRSPLQGVLRAGILRTGPGRSQALFSQLGPEFLVSAHYLGLKAGLLFGRGLRSSIHCKYGGSLQEGPFQKGRNPSLQWLRRESCKWTALIPGLPGKARVREFFCRTFYRTLIWNPGPVTFSQYGGPYIQGFGFGSCK